MTGWPGSTAAQAWERRGDDVPSACCGGETTIRIRHVKDGPRPDWRLVTGLVSTASAEPNFGTRAWWDQQVNG